jgi:hypothetical protein
MVVVKSGDNKFKAVNIGTMVNFTMDKCTSDLEQVKAWIQEVNKYHP